MGENEPIRLHQNFCENIDISSRALMDSFLKKGSKVEIGSVNFAQTQLAITTSISDIDHGKSRVNYYLERQKASIGRLAAVIDRQRARFSGIEILESERGRNLANILLKIFLLTSIDAELNYSETTKQEKPLVCHLLTKWGFLPSGQADDNRVDIVEADSGRTALHFSGFQQRERYVRSQNRDRQAEVPVLPEMHMDIQKIINSVYLDVTYRLKPSKYL